MQRCTTAGLKFTRLDGAAKQQQKPEMAGCGVSGELRHAIARRVFAARRKLSCYSLQLAALFTAPEKDSRYSRSAAAACCVPP